ncbi:hypothetical protein [Radiobacillus deserti]|uniref:Uncharacterized protein n=1 Tax=Radiobacillus deserti TaxID=2594883 RepID=A0A516KIH3_9BACI|nr:hypothetical protein [Radiobacillus deserti]QDP41198.1 hypothetical protein FN924_14010 [Radiobacillus deserti]
MKNITVMDWLYEEECTDREIDFILTFLPALSTLSIDYSKMAHIHKLLNKRFPDFSISWDKDYLQFVNFDSLIKEKLAGKFSTKELLCRMSRQEMCKSICDTILASST